jgi:hypothetical protein
MTDHDPPPLKARALFPTAVHPRFNPSRKRRWSWPRKRRICGRCAYDILGVPVDATNDKGLTAGTIEHWQQPELPA